ncbi:3-deoxy-manno-octulosonate cytidylyltransferase [Tahibacter sp.]|uniref:3-deoxy-manno-octulosonate cytidylyltransferase n=1 Tax=Tahibacter sp. TaxID=2056211 RepID=UPI0028C4F410|nr:3-deoxy-manno-octulosonate cytidylyltransferase [Tahibacter sp.]
MSDFIVAIPARYASTRLPGKPLSLIAGEPMVVHVARRAFAAGAREVVVATDDERIAHALKDQPVTVCMTRVDHASGSDRLAECVEQRGWSDDTVVVNLQGDEPLAPPSGIRAVADALIANDAPVATLATPIASAEELFNPNCVKLVAAGEIALYFSRAPIPWARDAFAAAPGVLPPGIPFLRHIGIYAYRAGFLRRYSQLARTPLEAAESLEQLRVLEHGYRIAVRLAPDAFPAGVDTPEDLARVNTLLGRP